MASSGWKDGVWFSGCEKHPTCWETEECEVCEAAMDEAADNLFSDMSQGFVRICAPPREEKKDE